MQGKMLGLQEQEGGRSIQGPSWRFYETMLSTADCVPGLTWGGCYFCSRWVMLLSHPIRQYHPACICDIMSRHQFHFNAQLLVYDNSSPPTFQLLVFARLQVIYSAFSSALLALLHCCSVSYSVYFYFYVCMYVYMYLLID